jgi:O-antigen/teichoic acid export membrane protein
VAEALGRNEGGNVRAAVRYTLRYGSLATVVVALGLYLGLGEWIALKIHQSPTMAGVTSLMVLWMVVTSLRKLLAEIFRGFHDIRMATALNTLDSTILPAIMFGVVWVVWKQASLAEVLVLSAVSGLAIGLFGGGALWRKMAAYRGAVTLTSKQVLLISAPLLVSTLAAYVLDKADFWVLGAYYPEEVVAVYGNAYKLVNLVKVSHMLVAQVVTPLIAELYSQNKKKQLQRMLRMTAFLAGVPAFASLAVFILFGDDLLGLVYGDYYRQGAVILTILCVGKVIGVWTGACQLGLMMTGHQNLVMYGTLFSGGLSLVLLFVLEHFFGVVGVAIASAISVSFQNLLMLYLMWRKTGIWTNMGHIRESVRILREFL